MACKKKIAVILFEAAGNGEAGVAHADFGHTVWVTEGRSRLCNRPNKWSMKYFLQEERECIIAMIILKNL